MNAGIPATVRGLALAAAYCLASAAQATPCEQELGCLSGAANSGTRPALVFIHGSPGLAEQFSRYVDDPDLAVHWDLFALDRPGFGHSQAMFTTDLRRQAQLLLAQLPEQPLTLAGHSLGGPVALWMALLAPHRVHKVVLLAASVAPEREQPRWFNRWAERAPLRWLMSRSWRQSNQEIMALADQLDALLQQAGQLQAALMIVQGAKDRLVHPASPVTLMAQLHPTLVVEQRIWERRGHLFPWRQYARTRDLFLDIRPEST